MRELSHHLLDLIENSLAAGASNIKVTVTEDTIKDVLCFNVIDNGSGLDEQQKMRISDPFVTSRRFRRVGLGLPLLQQAAHDCAGTLEIKSEQGKGTSVEATFQHSHIDRMPLGDVAATLVAAIAAKPDLNLLYEHTLNGQKFVFDTIELVGKFKETLTNNEVKVLSWIKNHCSNGIGNLYIN